MRIVITGAAGFLGSHLAGRFLNAGHEVIGIDNFLTGSRRNTADLEKNQNFTLVHHDISRPLYLQGAIDGVLHFASPASPADYLDMPIQTLKVGSLGTYHTLGLAKAKRARFLLASTSGIYGDPLVHPQEESYRGNVNPVGPRGAYGEAKRFAEAITMVYHLYHGVDTRIARIFSTYGPRMRPGDGRVISNFIVQALRGDDLTVYGDGEQTRSFCYVDDQVEGILRLFNVDRVHSPMNIGNPYEFTVLELAGLVLEATGSDSEVRYLPLPEDDPKARRPDIARARELLDWDPRVDLQDGLRRTIPFFREYAEEQWAIPRTVSPMHVLSGR